MVQVRWALRGEAPRVYSLFRALVEAEQAKPPDPSMFARSWGRSFRGGGFRFAVAEGAEGAIVGCMTLHAHYSTWKGAPVVSLEDFYVLPAQRSRGIGSMMLGFAEGYAQSLGAARVELHVRRDNARAQALYLKRGFEDTPYLWYHKGLPLLEGGPGAVHPEAPGMIEKGGGARRRGGR
ncbi:MAG TPA: GNAT family N-acetyltransferase, partial [Candidatus Thermoplasmatota archaeon]|nr:GNAT family N-acetyltransferase [Candidatus Thermoplasmatota archaeon]